ncbi:polyadenylate-binding protein 3-like [Hemibagrus wyckioides]|uniref:polyadenylate-binding protein 3-like n=1 Tax=Hemibagrus wyckioides TaxID=337641 RepID=UPI00266B8BB3|nr:polyadenylate-binding protein 3-like [Hemibagrus wyckioides]
MAALFVKDLHPEVSEVILSSRFRPAGHVQSVHICRDRKTGSPLGYAYVNFRYRDDAERAINMFNFELLLGRPMRVMWSHWEPTAKPIKGGNIFIKNLDWSIDCTSLFDTFSVFGRIVSCKVVESKRYGYVQYESAEAAALAIERLNGKLLNDRQVTIEYFRSWEERKVEVRRAEKPKLEARRAEEPKVEARMAEEPKWEVCRAEEATAEVCRAEKPKAEVRRAEKPKAEVRRAREAKADVCKAEEPKAELHRAEEPKAEEPKAKVCKAEEPKVEARGAEEPKVEACRAKEPKVEVAVETAVSEIRVPVPLQVDKMDALLQAREAGVIPEILKRTFTDGKKKRKKKKKKNKRKY